MTASFPATLETDATYASPSHLRTPFRSFIVSFDKGIYWLRMPQDTGKTQFIRGIVAKRATEEGAAPQGIDSAISSGMRAIAVELSPGATAQDLVAALKTAFEAEFGACEEAGPVPDLGGDVEKAQADFIAWLSRLTAAARDVDGKRLLVCIDGLEAAADAAPAIVDVLPSLDQIPAGLVLLLSSRPKKDWADGVYARAEAKFPAGPAVSIRELGLEDPEYADALRRVFKERLRPVMRDRAVAQLQTILETKAPFDKGGRDQRLTDDPTLRDALKVDWKKLTNKFPRYSGLQLPVAPLVPLLDQFDRLWVDVLDRSDRRYRYVHLLIQRIADGSLSVEEVGSLPQGAELTARLG